MPDRSRSRNNGLQCGGVARGCAPSLVEISGQTLIIDGGRYAGQVSQKD